ncbi:molybdate ABC transporter substrate-binding protein [Guptibacillus algicola]|uniref:molybdate ABC transporter substrate-binding protein n=1 Tax=Guptibacillus algicola TaxID=225844 RepID=UPI001CD4248A|nr:molybdate ABC transporter substrate-binding protein [Alkalihalobacillus algicola]MCA0986593.1 molybdate ABC transporter substrate-binding protein [Alkalihalobacillus algicola]
MKLRILLVVMSLILAGCQTSDDPNQTITVAAASSLSDAMEETIESYEETHPDIDISLHVASSGVLANQIKQEAPIDVFVSASNEHFSAVDSLMDDTYRTDLLTNELVVITKEDTTVTTWDDLLSKNVKRIAIGTPETVPAGAYAQEALTSMDLWKDLESKLIYSKDVRQVLTYVETGNSEAGIVYSSDLNASEDVMMVARVPQENYSTIIYPAGVVKGAPQAAEEFFTYLKSDQAMQTFEDYGFKRNE